MACRCAKLDPDTARYKCEVSGDGCIYLIPDAKRCSKEYGEGPEFHYGERDKQMKIKLTAEEAREQVFEGNEIQRIYGAKSRWSTHMQSIVEIDGKNYRIKWSEGATERQEDEFYDQEAEEVHQVEKTILVWEPKPQE
ncbi:MAG: hypothetical protein ACM3O3_05140 [Syntrophothermus sp.]